MTNAAGKITSLVNEVQMVELSDGEVMLNSRKWGGQSLRQSALSQDGGETWSPVTAVPALRDGGCMASIFRYSFAGKEEKSCLLFSYPDSNRRENGTIRLSYDDGNSWSVGKVLWRGSFAYSVLTRLPDGTIGCLYEANETTRIIFARFSLAWVEGKAETTAP